MTKTFADFRIDLPGGASGEVDVLCPECSPTRKKKHVRCLGVNVEKGTWLCQHCGWAGGLGTGAHRNDQLHWRKPVYVRPEAPAIPEGLDVGMVQFFATRGIPAGVLRRNRISTQRVYMPQVEDHVKAICFPYYRGDQYINAKYRDREKNFRMEAGAERILYGLNDIDPARVVIVEGEIDKLSVEVAGITSCVSVPDGAPAINAKNYDSKFTFLEADAERLEAVKEWIIAVDNDPPGTRLEEELVRRFGVGKCKRVVWPEGCKDANDVLVQHGSEVLAECIRQAEEFPIQGVIYGHQLAKEIELLYAEGESRGVSTGWPSMDTCYTVQPGEVTVITGTPGSGKSNWLDALLVNLARDHRWIVPMFSPENSPLKRHMSRLMEKYVREPFRHGPSRRMSPERREEALEWCSWHFPMIMPEDEEDWTLENIFKIAQALILRHGIRGLVIDPWNELEHIRPAHLSESEYIGLSLKKVRQFARRTKLHVWIVAHPAKLYRTKEGTYPMPSLYDISGSANWYNKPDNGLVIYRDKGNPEAPVEVYTQKIRERSTGEIGQTNFKYNKVLADYEEYVVRDTWGSAS
jgi:twinkle protein